MRKFEYKPPRVHSGELRTMVRFYRYKDNDGPEPGKVEDELLYSSWAKVEKVWLKDLEQAKANGTLEDITINMRDPLEDFSPSNSDFLVVEGPEYKDKVYNIKSVQPDLQDRRVIVVVASISAVNSHGG